MYRIDYTNLVAAALLVVAGLAVAGVSATQYDLGTVQRMGAGMFPTILGVVLAVLGLLIGIQALRQEGETPDIRVRSPIFILGGIILFAVIIRPFGMIPAIVAVVVVSSLAELEVKPKTLAMMCAALSVMASLVFVVGLGLPIPLIRWPL